MKKPFLFLMVASIGLFTACSKKNTAGNNTQASPTNYVTDIVPLIQAKCSPCHIPSKGGRKTNFEQYEGVKKYSADILARVQLNTTDRGFMPFKNEKLSAAEIVVIKKWIDQGLLEK
jgi:hypothetical protein